MPRVTWANGEQQKVKQSEYWARKGAFQARLESNVSFMRVGIYSVALGDGDMAIAVEYKPEEGGEWTKTWEIRDHQRLYRADRLRQLDEIEHYLEVHQHALKAEVVKEIERERNGWEAWTISHA